MRKANSDAEIVHATGAWRYWPLRLVVFLVVLFGIYLGWKLLFAALAPHMHAAPETVLRAVWNLAGIPILVAAYVVLVKRTEKRAVRELAPADLARLLAIGALVGAALFAAVCAILLLAHAATFGPFNAGNKALAVAAAALIAAVGEEIVFRGGLYRLLEEGLGTWTAIALSGALFGLAHALNHGESLASVCAIALEAGVLLAAAYAATRSLWLPIGLHFGWNFTEGGIFGAAGGNRATGLLPMTFSGPAWLTGGTSGQEASLPAIGVCLIAAIILLNIAARSGEWRPFVWHLRSG